MSLAQITEKIQKDAHAEAERVLSEARKQEAEIKKEADAKVKELEDASQSRFDKERPEIFRRREIVARLDINKLHLGAQRRLINDVFEGALENLRKLDRNKYVAFCTGLLKNAAKTGNEVIEFSRDEKYLDKAWVDRFNSEHSMNITVSDKKGDYSGGFVLSDGRIDINCSWEMLIQSAREQMETKVVKRLFPQ